MDNNGNESSRGGAPKPFGHMRQWYPADGKTWPDCEADGAVGPKGSMPGSEYSKPGEDGAHDQSAVLNFAGAHNLPHGEMNPEVSGAIESGEPTKGEGCTGPEQAISHSAPARTTSAGVQGVDHRPRMRPNATPFERHNT